MDTKPTVSWGTKESATPQADIDSAMSRVGYPGEAIGFAQRLDTLYKSFLKRNGRDPTEKEFDDLLRTDLLRGI